ncbi:MAG: hypothetical protein CMJ81_14690 [Planctomycetaceae bacterium]|nr:hypothetical protein [Planctomycetaceae bacterium]
MKHLGVHGASIQLFHAGSSITTADMDFDTGTRTGDTISTLDPDPESLLLMVPGLAFASIHVVNSLANEPKRENS